MYSILDIVFICGAQLFMEKVYFIIRDAWWKVEEGGWNRIGIELTYFVSIHIYLQAHTHTMQDWLLKYRIYKHRLMRITNSSVWQHSPELLLNWSITDRILPQSFSCWSSWSVQPSPGPHFLRWIAVGFYWFCRDTTFRLWICVHVNV